MDEILQQHRWQIDEILKQLQFDVICRSWQVFTSKCWLRNKYGILWYLMMAYSAYQAIQSAHHSTASSCRVAPGHHSTILFESCKRAPSCAKTLNSLGEQQCRTVQQQKEVYDMVYVYRMTFGQHPHIFLNINLRRHDNMDQKLAKLFCERS